MSDRLTISNLIEKRWYLTQHVSTIGVLRFFALAEAFIFGTKSACLSKASFPSAVWFVKRQGLRISSRLGVWGLDEF